MQIKNCQLFTSASDFFFSLTFAFKTNFNEKRQELKRDGGTLFRDYFTQKMLFFMREHYLKLKVGKDSTDLEEDYPHKIITRGKQAFLAELESF